MTSQEAEHTETADVSAQGDFLLYDGECPFCSFYARKSGFKTPCGRPLTLIDANRAPELLAGLRGQDCDVEEGMVLVLEGRRYQGAAAMTALAAMTGGTGWFGGLSRWFASNPKRVRAFYPWFRRLRRAALWLKGRATR
ncbi:MAG: DCC1-like thiol-disulfide oxidoreductase family protein [Nitrospinae bacterium]|nr:DCC1-like thiol-disulfide oxidoreductase family protein [Nitrospinota bacterium]